MDIRMINFLLFPRRQIVDPPKLNEFADDNFKFDENDRVSKKHCGKKEKLLVMSNFSFFHSVLKRVLLQTRKNQGPCL